MKDDVQDDILNQNGADLPPALLDNNAAKGPTAGTRARTDGLQDNILNQNGANNTGSGGDSDNDGGWEGDANDPKNA